METKLNVKLIAYTPDPEKVIASAAKLCYSHSGAADLFDGLDNEATEKFLRRLSDLGHASPTEHASFTFAIEGVSRACYDKYTEVLTHNGWKYFSDLKEDDTVATINENGVVEFQKPTDYIQYQYSGKMHKYLSQNIDLLITPNHNIYAKKYDIRTDADYDLIPSQDIDVNRLYMTKVFNYNNLVDDTFRIEGYSYERKNNHGEYYTKTLEDVVLDRVKFYKFLAWYLSEGGTYYNCNENSYSVSICQLDKKNIDHIMQCCRDIGVNPCYNGRNIKFKNSVIGRYLKQIGVSKDKYIPFNIFDNFTKDSAKIFIDEYLKGDGTVDKNGCGKLYTTSSKLANQLYSLCYIAGYTASVHLDDRVGQVHYINGNPIRHNHICFVINISMSGSRNREIVVKRDKHFSEVEYNDLVFCVTVPNHTLFVRRGGRAIWCGNCSHQLVRHRIASYSQQSQRYVNADGFNYIIPPEIAKDQNYKAYFEKAMSDINEKYNSLQQVLETGYINDGMKKSAAEKKANEDARYILPNAAETKIVVTMNARQLIHFFSVRCCNRSQWEIRALANEMLKQCKEIAPTVFNKAGAPCLYGECPEGTMSCKQK